MSRTRDDRSQVLPLEMRGAPVAIGSPTSRDDVLLFRREELASLRRVGQQEEDQRGEYDRSDAFEDEDPSCQLGRTYCCWVEHTISSWQVPPFRPDGR